MEWYLKVPGMGEMPNYNSISSKKYSSEKKRGGHNIDIFSRTEKMNLTSEYTKGTSSNRKKKDPRYSLDIAPKIKWLNK